MPVKYIFYPFCIQSAFNVYTLLKFKGFLAIMSIVKKRKKNKISFMAKTHEEIRQLKASNLKRIRESKGLSQTQLATVINTYPSTLNAIERGNKGLGSDLLVRICQALQVDASEFTRPIGNEKIEIPPPAGEIAVMSLDYNGQSGSCDGAYTASGFRYIKRPYDVTDENAYAVEVRGESMSPRYEPGEVVVVSPQHPVNAGDYVVAKLHNGEVMIKRITFRDNLIILGSVNPAVEPCIYAPDEVLFFHKIVWKKEKG